MTQSNKRTGSSLIHTVTDCPKALMLTLEFSEEQASRMMNVRRILPFVENRKEPCIDARKLWERLGKPHKRFRDWAAHYIKPLAAEGSRRKAEISAILTLGKTKPQQDYLLSRDVAAHLAMQANTDEGEAIREYFLDMEDLVLKLARHGYLRAATIVKTDNELSKATIVKVHESAKAIGQKLSSYQVKQLALIDERAIKSLVAKALTGIRASRWRTYAGKGVRDVLRVEHLDVYAKAYNVALALCKAGMPIKEIERVLEASFGMTICMAEYLDEQQIEWAIEDWCQSAYPYSDTPRPRHSLALDLDY
ncbi:MULTISPECIES: antA/AntB antirepressor family protein [Chromobacterium]|uniref:AntA/AntB antirepressor family protein n=1 Tax=Chromobacterium aquaticum TaxID=467180 RepID=A0ABV8ZXP8_9NEIS|nr:MULTISPECIES: antA/AntB antirepressor family protein [Chromobacterium]KMN38238.1 hypothetical protein VI26_00345 [Chromobacterium sp. LK1]MCD5360511.1 antA/AntB antirepressor family protein [Chromobacterium aquaticum]